MFSLEYFRCLNKSFFYVEEEKVQFLATASSHHHSVLKESERAILKILSQYLNTIMVSKNNVEIVRL